MKALVNFLSIFRIAAAFAVPALLLEQYFALALFVFALAAITDFLDGYMARKFHVETKAGGVLDHMGDKFLVVNALVMTVMFLQIWLAIAPALIMICRELYVSGLREFMGGQKIEFGVPKYRFSLGKIKAASQMASLILLLLWIWAVNEGWNWLYDNAPLLEMPWQDVLFWMSVGGLWLSALLAFASAAQYTVSFIGMLKKIK
jgi:CDP-diacylglycerol--glycerol-3-phosphate 3-phosphatidyltransferase